MKALVLVMCIVQCVSSQKVCLDSRHHKTLPGPEDRLHEECIPWKEEACCTGNTTHGHLHGDTNMYGFTLNFCGSSMSDACRRHFHRDLCFYECEPNLGPWIVKVKRKFARERFFEVPLCKTDCNAWWDDCRHDWACVRNWAREFRWRNGINTCPEKCVRFDELYSNASDFCSNVWDHSWKVVPDDMACMRIWFDGSQGNPNRAVAEYYRARRSSAPSLHTSVALLFLSIVLL